MQQYKLLCLLLLFICGYYAQDPTTTPMPPPEWNGDPNICTVDPTSTVPPLPPLPVFPSKAEFALEQVEIIHTVNATEPSQLTMYQYLYDYDANSLILIKNVNGFVDVEYYYYNVLKVSKYYRREFCVVQNITTDIDTNGLSATTLQNGTWHIRPLHEFLLFSSNDPRRPVIRPKYIGQTVVRGIPVDQWESCIVDKNIFRTIRRVWSFAQKGISMPTGVVDTFAVPVEAKISSSLLMPNGSFIGEVDEVFNVHSFRPGIIESIDQLAPPKGVFCKSGNDQNLISLQDIRMEWPDRFSVRVEASTSRSAQWQRFHLRFDRGNDRGSRRLRYDYLPPGAEDFETVIHDYGDNLTYIIDRRQGSCKISRGIEITDVSPTRDPIGFFIRNERRFISATRPKAWEFNGFRSCRGDAIKCTVVTSQIEDFPVLIDPDTGSPNGETWGATNIEYGWAMRAPLSQASIAQPTFDYPVHLYLKLFRFRNPSNPSPFNIITEDIEYEFYEMSHERHPYDFDTSICYRSLNLDYLHLGFRLRLDKGSLFDGNHLNRRILERDIHRMLVNRTGVGYARISELEIDHERANNIVRVFFTLLGPTPAPELPTMAAPDELAVEQGRINLARAIEDGKFEFTMTLTDDPTSMIQFKAVSGSLSYSKQFMSTHAVGSQVINESYTKGSQAGAVIGGILVGLVVGILLAAAIRIIRKEPMPAMPSMPTSMSNPLPNISFYNKKPTSDTTTTSASDA